MDQAWIDITVEQPPQQQRSLMKFADSRVRIGDYDRFDWRLWGVIYWKPLPNDERQ